MTFTLSPLGMPARFGAFCRRFARDERGISVIEFAMLVPLLFTLYLGISEISVFITADRKATQVASAVGDLASQSVELTNDDITDIFDAAEVLVRPFDSSTLTVIVSSIERDGNQFRVLWSEALNTASRGVGSTVALPDEDLIPAGTGQTIILSEVQYVHNSPLGNMFTDGLTVTDTFYLRPRRTLSVARVP
ncbi:MAG: TadE/TadG family type IV pilus assembly protein [Pseudomonadota bacterium]